MNRLGYQLAIQGLNHAKIDHFTDTEIARRQLENWREDFYIDYENDVLQAYKRAFKVSFDMDEFSAFSIAKTIFNYMLNNACAEAIRQQLNFYGYGSRIYKDKISIFYASPKGEHIEMYIPISKITLQPAKPFGVAGMLLVA